ncbi:unnamed protein product, partial [Polarella glacialis]
HTGPVAVAKGLVPLCRRPTPPSRAAASTVAVAAFIASSAAGVTGGRRAQRPSNIGFSSLEVLMEDEHVLVINKPAGLLSQSASRGDDCLVKRARHHLAQGNDPFVGLVHRLDRDVTGVCILAKTKLAARWLSRQFASRTVRKEYVGIVRRWSSEGVRLLRNTMEVDEGGQAHEADPESPGAQAAALECRSIGSGPSGASALLVRLHTGRRHQIRYQLATAESALLGDRRYGSGCRDGSRKWIQRPALHAWRLRFAHPAEPHSVCE